MNRLARHKCKLKLLLNLSILQVREISPCEEGASPARISTKQRLTPRTNRRGREFINFHKLNDNLSNNQTRRLKKKKKKIQESNPKKLNRRNDFFVFLFFFFFAKTTNTFKLKREIK